MDHASYDGGNGAEDEAVLAGGGDFSSDEHTEYYGRLIAMGINEVGAALLENMVVEGILTETDLEERAFQALAEFDAYGCEEVLKEFTSSGLSHISNKTAYLCGLMKTRGQTKRTDQATGHTAQGVQPGAPSLSATSGGPNEDKIKAILERTGYTFEVTTGQRKYGGPPPDWKGRKPGAGHELFIGKVPKFVYEDDLIPLLEKCGRLWEVRLMMDPATGFNRGFGFATFCDKQSASKAVTAVNGYEIKPGRRISVNVSIANARLFVGNIPKTKSKEEIQEEFTKVSEGIIDVIVYAPADDPKKKNRGFAFIEYESHKSASVGRRKLTSGRYKVFGSDVVCDWADPLDEPDDEVMQKVKVLYVRNLTAAVSEEMLKEKFEPYGKVERVKKVKDYGFVHFEEREHALQAMNDLNGQKLGLQPMEICLAKPVDKNKKQRRMENPQGFGGGFDHYGGPRGGGGGGGGWGSPAPMRGRRGGPPGMRPPRRPGMGRGGYYGRPDYDMGYGAHESYDYDDNQGYGEDYGGDYGGDYGQEGGYDDYYEYPPEPPVRTRPPVRPPPLARGMRRGVPRMLRRGGPGIPGRGQARGAFSPPMPRGGRGGPRGGRGGPMGRGGAMKRKSFEEPAVTRGGNAPKRRVPDTGGDWGAAPIVQQPLGGGGGEEESEQWYQDSYGGGW